MELILIDTSIWVDHISRPIDDLGQLVGGDRAVMHPFVLMEIALGNLADWDRRIGRLRMLPKADPVSADAAIFAVRDLSLQDSGLGFVDTHLLAWATAAPDRRLWSRDRRLVANAEAAGVAWMPPG